jgi:hypothetical protein
LNSLSQLPAALVAVTMTTQLVVEFDWVRDPKGYHLDEKGRVVRNGKGHRPEDQEPASHSLRQTRCF